MFNEQFRGIPKQIPNNCAADEVNERVMNCNDRAIEEQSTKYRQNENWRQNEK
jgi:hypothetical protein